MGSTGGLWLCAPCKASGLHCCDSEHELTKKTSVALPGLKGCRRKGNNRLLCDECGKENEIIYLRGFTLAIAVLRLIDFQTAVHAAMIATTSVSPAGAREQRAKTPHINSTHWPLVTRGQMSSMAGSILGFDGDSDQRLVYRASQLAGQDGLTSKFAMLSFGKSLFARQGLPCIVWVPL